MLPTLWKNFSIRFARCNNGFEYCGDLTFFEESMMGALVKEEVGKGVTGVQVSISSLVCLCVGHWSGVKSDDWKQPWSLFHLEHFHGMVPGGFREVDGEQGHLRPGGSGQSHCCTLPGDPWKGQLSQVKDGVDDDWAGEEQCQDLGDERRHFCLELRRGRQGGVEWRTWGGWEIFFYVGHWRGK